MKIAIDDGSFFGTRFDLVKPALEKEWDALYKPFNTPSSSLNELGIEDIKEETT